jgi:TolB protein
MSFHEIDDATLLAYADGALDPSRRAEVAALLEDAPELQQELDQLLQLQHGLRTTFDAADLLPAPNPATWQRIRKRSIRNRWRRVGVVVGVGAAALLLVALVLLRGYGRQPMTAVIPTETIKLTQPAGSYAQTSDAACAVEVPAGNVVKVPDMRGMSEEAARQCIKARGLIWSFTALQSCNLSDAVCAQTAPNAVMRSAPASGEQAKPGTTVDLFVRAPSLAEIRRQSALPVFVPTRIPAESVPDWLGRDATSSMTINYHNPKGMTTLLVTSGTSRCCVGGILKEEPSVPLTLSNGIAGHLIAGDGKEKWSMIWWEQAGALVAVSGPQLDQATLSSIAASVSSTAELSDSQVLEASPVPSPIPTGALPSGRIAFAIMRDPIADGACGRLGVYVLNAGASEPTHIADGCNPVLSPDQTRVAYLRGGHIFVRGASGADSGMEINITGADLFGGNPAWSSDSRKIVFSGDRGDQSQIYTVDADGKHLTQITHSTADLGSGRPGIDPIWSPDGKRIAFTVSPALPQTDANWDIFIINADGSHMTRLTDDPARDELIGWTPDGRQILFFSDRSGKTQTYSMNADGRRQAPFLPLCEIPAWSPDRSRIACSHAGQLFIANGDGSQPIPLAVGLTNIFNPIWSPDGQYIVFGSFSADWQAGALYVVRADSTGLTRLTQLIAADKSLQWVQR